ncbi:MAG TPA: hypothetical protein VFQ17_14580, partial [Nocardioides sp.]|nr:hypothetical protein [Nocardioides sp.]
VLAGAGILAWRRPLRVALTVAAVAVLTLNTAVHADVRTPLADRRYVELPAVGWTLVTDGAGRIDEVIRGGFVPPSEATPAMSIDHQRLWVRHIREVARGLDVLGGTTNLTAFGFRHDLVNANAVQFEQLAAGRPPLILDQIAPAATPDEASMAAWLQAIGACRLMTAPGEIFEIEPVVDQPSLRSAARAVGFVRTEHVWRLPDRRSITVWENPACG